MKDEKRLLWFGGFLVFLWVAGLGLWLVALCYPDLWESPDSPLTETKDPTLFENGKQVVCDPFTEVRKDSDATRAKYKGKTILLHGIASGFRGCDGEDFIYCSGPKGEVFCIVVTDDDDFKKVKLHHRVIVRAEMHQFWTGCGGYFDDLTVWNGRLQEIQESVHNGFQRGWETIWKAP